MSCTSCPAIRHAGTMATASPASVAASAANVSTRKSSATSLTRGRSIGAVVTKKRSATAATAMPRAPPAAARTSCSSTTRPTSLRLLAPSAVRMAASRSRASVRVRERLARFEHATIRTAPIAASSITSPRRAPPTIESESGRTSVRRPTLCFVSAAASRAMLAWRTSSSACAESRVASRFSRPTTA